MINSRRFPRVDATFPVRVRETAGQSVVGEVTNLDFYLPGMSGLQFLETLARQGRRIPVVVVSAASESDAVSSLKAGVLHSLQKPLRLEELRLTLNMLELTSTRERLETIQLRFSWPSERLHALPPSLNRRSCARQSVAHISPLESQRAGPCLKVHKVLRRGNGSSCQEVCKWAFPARGS